MTISKLFTITFLIVLFFSITLSQTPTPTPTPSVVGEVNVTTKFANNDPLYQKIRQNLDKRNLGEVAVVNNLIVQKDRGVFTLRTGEIYFLEPVEGRVTGAVFIGDGEFSLTPPVEIEKKHLAIFTDAPEIKEQFSELVMYFTDKTFEEVKNSPNVKMTTNGSKSSAAASALQEKGNLLKRQFRFNMSSRILADFLTSQRPGFFTSFIDGKKYSKLLYQIDPLGLTDVYPEQVSLTSYDANDSGGIWTAFHLDDEYKKGTANSWTDRRIYDITNHDMDIVVKGTQLFCQDTLTFQTTKPDIRFIPFDLFRTLRVKAVRSVSGEEFSFIQEKKDEDADFGIILDKAPEVGKPIKILVEYEGDGAVISAGSGNYILGPRSTWYPNNPYTAFADRASFNLTFHYPKGLTMVGIGDRVGEDVVEGDTKVSKWSTNGVDYEVAGFNYGDFKVIKFNDPSGYELEVYANNEVPEFIKEYQMQIENYERARGATGMTIGALSTTDGMKKVMAEAQNATRLYNLYFGKTPYKRIAMTQQPAGNFGQAWATLVFMPFTAYINKTQMVQMMGVQGGTNDFWTTVGPHEVAHEWWGHTVGWTSYHDQWMSEGFSELSASIYVQYVEKDINRFIKYWEDQRQLITESSPTTKGLKPYTVGPVTQGYRLNSGKTGNIARAMIYPKGAYILHMLRMMMYDHGKSGDARFKAMMQDFIKANFNKPVSTNDFKLAVERNMTPAMDIDKNKSMNWFFDEWVYGTAMPSYKLEYKVSGNSLTGKVTQSGVSKDFVMIVPLYIDFGTGWQSVGSVTLVGNDTADLGTINIPKEPKKFAIAAMNDVLAEKIENIKLK